MSWQLLSIAESMALDFRKLCAFLFVFATVGCADTGAANAQVGRTDTALFLLRSPATEKAIAAIGGDHARLLTNWRSFLTRNSIPFTEIDMSRVASLPAKSVLIMPSIIAMSTQDESAIVRYANAGGALLATWAAGARDEGGVWRGYGFLEREFGLTSVSEVAAKFKTNFLILYGDSPISTRISAGFRFPSSTASEALMVGRAPFAAATYGDWLRNSGLPADVSAAISLGELRGSRRIWFGFPETYWPIKSAEFDALLVDCLEWLSRTPKVSVANWPAPYRAAITLTMDTEEQFGNAKQFADQLEARKFKGTFYLLTSEMVKNEALARQLAERHEVGMHGEIHTGFAGLPAKEQAQRLARVVADANRTLGPKYQLQGFRAPEESFDRNTELAVRAAGFRHQAVDSNLLPHALPDFSNAEPNIAADSRLITLPRTWPDDLNLLADSVRIESLSDLYREAAERTLRSASFGYLSLHTQNFEINGLLYQGINSFLDFLDARRQVFWIATAGQVERWWRSRSAVTVSASVAATGLHIELQAERPIEAGMQLLIFGSDDRKFRSVKSDTLKNLNSVPVDAFRSILTLPSLPAGRSIIRVQLATN